MAPPGAQHQIRVFRLAQAAVIAAQRAKQVAAFAVQIMVFYLMSRGMSEEDARALIVSGFADNVGKELPLEYAVEMNNLIRLEMKGSIG